MVVHSMLLLSYWYRERVKSNIVNSSFSYEIANLSVEFTMYIQKYDLLLNINGWSNKTSKGGMDATIACTGNPLKFLVSFPSC